MSLVLRVVQRLAALKGGDSHGPDILARKAKNSPLIKFTTTDSEVK